MKKILNCHAIDFYSKQSPDLLPTLYLREAIVLLQPNNYKNIFGENKKDLSQYKQRNSYLRIYNPRSNRKIYRQFNGCNCCTKDEVAMDFASFYELGLDTNAKDPKVNEIEVTRACWFMFFFYHPNSATRISFKIGTLSIALSIIGFLLSLFI